MKLLSVLLSVAGVWVLVNPVFAAPKDTASHKTGSRGKAADLLAQRSNITRVTGVELNQTDDGLEVIIKTPVGGERLIPLILPEGNNVVVDILDATLGFSIRNGVIENNPAPGIRSVALDKVNDSSIRLTITAENQALDAEVLPGRDNVVLSVKPEAAIAEQEPDREIEIIATGEAEEDDYQVDDATVGTRTDTPIEDIPQSIQVVPQEVIKDQRISNVTQAVQNVAGVAPGVVSPRGLFNNFTIRGFDAAENSLVNGLPDQTNSNLNVFNNIERVEVLKGPASVLFGQGPIGGVVNYVTKQPLSEPLYSFEVEVGNFNLYSGAVDLSGPLRNEDLIIY